MKLTKQQVKLIKKRFKEKDKINSGTFEDFKRECEELSEQEQKILKWWKECVALKDPDILDFIIQDVNNNFGKPDKTKITKELEKLKDIL